MPYHAKPTERHDYDHERRLRDGAQIHVAKGIANSQFLRATANRIWLAKRPDRLKLMGGR